MFSTYCNCETNDISVSYEYSHGTLSFEFFYDGDKHSDKVYVQNIGDVKLTVYAIGLTSVELESNELLDLTDKELMEKKSIEQFKNSRLSQEDICKLLSGE